MEVMLNNNQFYFILERFYSKFMLRKRTGPNPNKYMCNREYIYLIKAYKIQCVYTDNENKKKDNLVIKYTYKNNDIEEFISLNVLLDEYKDLI
jgi:hypothetical protein